MGKCRIVVHNPDTVAHEGVLRISRWDLLAKCPGIRLDGDRHNTTLDIWTEHDENLPPDRKPLFHSYIRVNAQPGDTIVEFEADDTIDRPYTPENVFDFFDDFDNGYDDTRYDCFNDDNDVAISFQGTVANSVLSGWDTTAWNLIYTANPITIPLTIGASWQPTIRSGFGIYDGYYFGNSTYAYFVLDGSTDQKLRYSQKLDIVETVVKEGVFQVSVYDINGSTLDYVNYAVGRKYHHDTSDPVMTTTGNIVLYLGAAQYDWIFVGAYIDVTLDIQRVYPIYHIPVLHPLT